MYINFMNKENKDIYVTYWLLLITILVAFMIVIGGLTRLTDSGLSITRWDLISGIIPPLSKYDWEKLFSLYKEIPEYKILNSSMSLLEFKTIFWWEYVHRLLGRIIGIFYLLPLIYFSFTNKFNKKKLVFFYFILILIVFQGFIGLYMVQSGLVEKTDVSHYRLSVHLTLAFVIFVFLFWNLLDYKKIYISNLNYKIPYFLPIFFLILIFIQISVGALVSGLDAGQIYNTWPLMNGDYFPDDEKVKNLFTFNSLDSASIVQFIHRNIAYLISFLFFIILIIVFINNNYKFFRKIVLINFIFLIVQFFLGILTLLSGANIILASLHQIGSIFLVSASLILVYKNYKIN